MSPPAINMPIDGHFADLRPAEQAAHPFPAIVPDAAEAAVNRTAAAAILLCLDLQQHSATALRFLHEVSEASKLRARTPLAGMMHQRHHTPCCCKPPLEQHTSIIVLAPPGSPHILIYDTERGSCSSLYMLYNLPAYCQVHQHPRLAEERFLAAAVRRYERCWLPLLAVHTQRCAAASTAEAHGSKCSSPAGIIGSAPAAAAAAAESGRSAADDAAAAMARSDYRGQLAAPLDVAWVWWAHSIAPAAYRQV